MPRSFVSDEFFTVPRVTPYLGRELASERATSFWGTSGEDLHPSLIVQNHTESGQRFTEVYDHMLRTDTDLSGLWEKRWKAVIGLPRYIMPADDSPLAREVAEFCRTALGYVPNLHTNLAHQLESIPKGLAIDEIVWERIPRGPLADAVVPVDLIDRPLWRFGFRNGQLFIRTHGTGGPKRLPQAKFLCMRHGTKDSPWGAPLLDRVHFFWHIRRAAWRYYANWLERYAQPTPIAKYPRATGAGDTATAMNKESRQTLVNAISNLQSEFGLVVPKDVDVDLLQSVAAGATYEQFVSLINRAYALIFLGEVDTSGLSKGPGSYAKNRVSNDVRLETIRIDAHELSTHLTDNLLRPMTLVNFGEDAPVPQWWIDTRDAEDQQSLRDGAAFLLDHDQPVSRRHLYSICGAPMPSGSEDVVAKKAQPLPPVMPPLPTNDDENDEEMDDEAA